MMYNLVIIVILVMLLFLLSHDTKFAALFTKNHSFQIIVGIILLYFSLNQINFGILLVVTVLLMLRYSYINTNILGPLQNRYKTPLLKDLHNIIEKMGDVDTVTSPIEKEELSSIIKTELTQLFKDMDRKMDSIIDKKHNM